ncbi:MAG: glycosyltransferase family 39 protein [Clostridia bacterium]|nr:glycosyltransferase family 39 protein [Clostridia bacterium]
MKKTDRTDRIIALLLAVAVFALTLTCTTDRPFWGDDYAAYLNEGIAIAEGRFGEQKALNYRAHPTDIRNPQVTQSGELTYVWGYPLLIAGVYSLVGYDAGSMVWYRMISVGFFAVFTGVFYLWCRRRFPRWGALPLAAFLGTCRVLYGGIDMYYSDVLFVSLTGIALYLAERFTDTERGKGRVLCGLLLGLTLFLAKETRHNGFSVALAAFGGLALDLFRTPKERRKEKAKAALIPLAAMLVPLIVLEGFVFGKATSDGMPHCDLKTFLFNLRYAVYTVKDWLAASLLFRPWSAGMTVPATMKLVAYGMMAVMGVGLIGRMLPREWHYAIFAAGNLIGVSLLPFAADQSGRYHYFLLPFAVLCFGYGVRVLWGLCKKLSKGRLAPKPRLQRLVWIPVGAYCIAACGLTLAGGPAPLDAADCAYGVDALEMYAYIRENTAEDCTILTQKPRVLRLNTGRDCIAIANGHTAGEAQYFLDIRANYYSDTVPKELIATLGKEELRRIGNLTLYRLTEGNGE